MGITVLVAVLDWGLGHATRMVPVIDGLIRLGALPILASSGASAVYLRNRYPNHISVEIPAPEVAYNNKGAGIALLKRSFRQPAINRTQYDWTKRTCAVLKVDAIISDNVYGAYTPDLPSALITHQVGLMTPFFKPLFDRVLAGWLHKFGEIWVPDMPDIDSLAGDMTENLYLKSQPIYIGRLSRLRPKEHVQKDTALLALVSGPEPQRSAMEAYALKRFSSLDGKMVLIRGGTSLPPIGHRPGLEIHNFLDDEALAHAIQSAELVVCRSGYSTLCDLIGLGAMAQTLPTPQQPEQIYLARRCAEKGWFAFAENTGFSADFNQNSLPKNDPALLDSTLKKFIEKF